MSVFTCLSVVGITQANIWKFGVFKSLGALFSSPTRSITCVIIPETGIVGKEDLRLATGYAVKDTKEYKGAWTVYQKLMLSMEGCDTYVLPISERSRVPLDPLGRLTAEDQAKLLPLTSIAETRYDVAFAEVSEENKRSANAKMLTTMMYVGGIIAVAAILINFARGCAR